MPRGPFSFAHTHTHSLSSSSACRDSDQPDNRGLATPKLPLPASSLRLKNSGLWVFENRF